MQSYSYFDFLAIFGVGGAHPGGIPLTKEIVENEQITSKSDILDAGCGTGQTAAYLYNHFGANVTGLEINPTMIKKARKRFATHRLPIRLIEGSIENIPFQDNSFDFIICESVLAFVQKDLALSEFYRVLRNGGRLIANEMTINSPLDLEEQEEIMTFYGVDSLLFENDWKKILEHARFTEIKTETKIPSIHSDHQMPEFHFSANVEPELFGIMQKHSQIMIQYQDSLSYRILTCTKP
ncbi:class I SAM-dependent methyltransferase [Bacillota bacterium Lsc_1132]